ncbi:MAG TPA: DAK2 domain-containing protein [Nitrolancea sp.]|nr:DAK2 domain-containing protein [Nitrolancea sp.]
MGCDRRVRWSGEMLVSALETATALFAPRVSAINALNVFPVPDGDTGTNMYYTLQAAFGGARCVGAGHDLQVGQVLAGAAHGALMGARGNSGVILYQILAGLSERAQDAVDLDGPTLTAGLRRAAELAYGAVLNPVEGTMLTVIRSAAEGAELAVQSGDGLGMVLDSAYDTAAEALRRTPEMLDVLRQAGVVDAGGSGLVILLDGLRRFSAGVTLEAPADEVVETPAAASMTFLDQVELSHGGEGFGYCTNFLVTGHDIHLETFRAEMSALGSSAVVVGEVSAVKVHLHSGNPGTVLEAALRYGELHQVRIDNMSAQTRRLLDERAATGKATRPRNDTGIGIVSVANGSGLIAVLRGLGASEVVPGGPTLNPSTEDLLRAVEAVPESQVILLPNDGNIIPTARQVGQLTTKTVAVVPSRTIPQGISALSAFNFDADLARNAGEMTEALGWVRSLAVGRASRDASIDGVTVRFGEFIGLLDGELRAAGDDALQVVLDLLAQLDPEQSELVTIFIGEPASPDLGTRVTAAVNEAYPGLAVEVSAGGQPHYDLIISVE